MKEYYLLSSLSLRYIFSPTFKISFLKVFVGFFFVIQIACFSPVLIFFATNTELQQRHMRSLLYCQFSL